jgi:acetyl esterase/lipase
MVPLLLLLLAMGAAAAEPVRHIDLPYVPGGHERQRLDLHLPAEGKNWPLVVWVHGGAWRAGDKKNISLPAPLLERGFALASVNYRLSQHATFPAQIQDVKAAIRWLRANTAQYGYDAGRIGVWGPSAGGHLVALLGVTGSVRDLNVGLHLEHSSRVQAVVDYFGPTDFLKMDEQGGSGHSSPDSPESALVGGPIAERRELVAKANPITYIAHTEAGRIPPFLIVHGDADRTVPPGQSVLLHEALRGAGVESELIVLKGAGHGGPAFQSPETIDKVAAFLRRHVGVR